jgi:23S rRNA (uracil1939-C5)-methyltransferase
LRNRLFKKGQDIEVVIDDMAFGGKGIAKIQTETGGFAVFVQNAIPGQRVRCRVAKCQQAFAEAALEEVLEPSPLEIEVPFHPIPGAPYITLPIAKQTEYKVKGALELYKRIGKVSDPEAIMDEFIPSPRPHHYRNKMEYSFSAITFNPETRTMEDTFGLGFKHRGTWWAVDNLDGDSGLFDAEFENQLPLIRQYLENTGLPPWHAPKRTGFYRFLTVRKSYFTNQLLINFVTTDSDLERFDIKAFISFMKETVGPRLAGIVHSIGNGEGDRSASDYLNTNLLFGEHKIIEIINGLEFEISPGSFFQPNPKCAELLYQKAIDYAGRAENGQVLLDLFCGTGTIAQLLAKSTGCKVIGVDIVEDAIEDANRNARRNRVRNVTFFAEDVDKFLLNHPEFRGKIATIVLDPPRAGISPKAMQRMIQINAPRIVYVSCNPATQSRDIELLGQAGYRLVKFSLIDQFPHTAHIEAVALFEKS